MSDALIQLIPGTLPQGFCPTSWQALLNMFMSTTTGILPGEYGAVIISETEPDADDRDKLWWRLISSYPDRLYSFVVGVGWVAKHEIPPGDKRIFMFSGTSAEVDTLDGGVAGAVGVDGVSGPFWEIVTEFAARSPIGVGTRPDVGTVMAVNTDHGEDTHPIDVTELPAHSHTIAQQYNEYIGSGGTHDAPNIGSYTQYTAPDTKSTGVTGGGIEMSLLHPVRAVYFIKRTARVYYLA